MTAYNQISQSAVYRKDEIAVTLSVCGGSYGGGSEVLVVQETTGTLSPGAHAGSYNGQDAYNDMLVVKNGMVDRQRTSTRLGFERIGTRPELLGRSAESIDGLKWGG